MDFGLSIDADYAVIDGIEYVTIIDDGSKTVVSHVPAKRSNPTNRDFAVGYDQSEVVWRVWSKAQPMPGDVIRDSANEQWVVSSVTSSRIGRRIINYRCVCKGRVGL